MRGKAGGLAVAVLAVAISSCSKDPQKLKKQYSDSGDAYLAKKNYAEAIVQYRNAVAVDGSFGEARLKLGGAYEATGDFRNALREYVRAADLMPANLAAQLRAGQMLLMARQYPDAKGRAVALLEKDPTNVDGLILMGNALAGLKDFDGAVTLIESAIDKDPTRTLWYENLGLMQAAKGDKSAALAAFQRAITLNPKSPSAHASLANYYWSSGQLKEAETELKTALSLDPKSPTVLRSLAAFYINLRRFNEAETYLKSFAEVSGDIPAGLTLADFYLSVQKPDAAVATLEQLVKKDEGFGPATIRLAAIEYDAKRHEHAYELVESVLKKTPKNEQSLLLKARFLVADRKYPEALAIAKQVVTNNQLSIPGKFVEGMTLDLTGDTDGAITAFQDLLKLSPRAFVAQVRLAELYLAKEDFAAAEEHAGQALKQMPTSGIAHYALARAFVGEGKIRLAEVELAKLAQTNENLGLYQSIVGELQFAKRDLTRSRAAFARAYQIRPDSLDALTGLTKIDLVEKKFPPARTRLEQRLAEAPNNTRVLMLAATVYVASGDRKKAEDSLRKVIELDPSNFSAYGGLGTLYMMQNRLDEAKRDFEELARRQPKSAVGAQTMIGTIMGMQNKPQEARKHYEQALATDPQAAVAANNLAWQYAESGENLDMALSLAQTAKARLPNSWEAGDTLGWIYYKKGLATLAVTALRQCVSQNPSNPILQYHLGLAQLKAGSPGDARKALTEALKLDPKFEAAEDAKRVLATIKG
jgi:tetratricopeptide (TPR) repeat protein